VTIRTLPLACFLIAASAVAQTNPSPGAAPLAFDAASVRPSKAGIPQHTNVPLDSGNVYGTIGSDDARTAAGGYLIVTHQPLWRYITFAYKLSGTQEMALRFSIYSGLPKSGAPFWVTGSFDASPEFFDISARAPADTSIDQMRLMMQSLLADRFGLVVHHTTVDAPVFALLLARPGVTGPNLQPHPPSDTCSSSTPGSDQPAPSPKPEVSPSPVGELPPVCGVVAHVSSSTPGLHFGGRGISPGLLATSLPTMTGLAAIPRPVVDQTGLSGLYDFTLWWTPDPADPFPQAAPFHDALKSQLGLELKSSRAPIDILVIDHVDHPSPN
jgi:uncharacterized protein (TIGR03435 family)